jgi:hypothetical protein
LEQLQAQAADAGRYAVTLSQTNWAFELRWCVLLEAIMMM